PIAISTAPASRSQRPRPRQSRSRPPSSRRRPRQPCRRRVGPRLGPKPKSCPRSKPPPNNRHPVSDPARSDAATARAERAYLARSRYRFRLAVLAFALAFVLIGGRLVTLGFAGTGQSSGGLYDISS